MGMVIASSLSVNAQTSKSVGKGGPYTVAEVVYLEDGTPLSTGRVLIYDSYNDYELSKQFQSKEKKDWLFAQGEASGNLSEASASYIKDEAQEAAYSQLAGQLERKVSKVHKHVRIIGQRDGMNRNDHTWKDGFISTLKGQLPQASMQFAYKIEQGNGNITYIVGVGVDMKKAMLISKKLMDEDAKAAGDADIDDLMDDLSDLKTR